ncbi:MAG: amino acid ABC transporter permease [Candidatus Competibacteraceae bacterium]|nr:amino acid ABC transporter permease [Candidatus Competibacteraceae bacterium]MBK7982992.1 amino acid ABC transporter permease [Candidatus Competibacteraceae bacterium]MBK8898456.1 amino acid ABC transporter permease [Candidatus Competibacteraceae bacterium]MBK8962265.1 amino acid ABC transporter permease [Candidatus Competibacteraceae bacterium]MBK9951483.1 amino acid ABC transporter permease [Candidatus Competibacteraceae bacterium]
MTEPALTPVKPPFWNDPHTRAIAFQAIALIATVAFGLYVFHNTQDNLRRLGIASGFGFLSSPSGFDIIQTLVPYSPTSSYGRVFWVALLNTLVVSALGIVLATSLGFIIGIARLSKNWLISRLALVYIETFRNIPLLLQIFFWYFAVLRAVPPPRQSLHLGDAVFLNIRGLYLPAPQFQPGFGWVLAALGVAVGLTWWLFRWARRRQMATGQPFPTLSASLALWAGLPLLTYWLMGSPLVWQYPELQGFNFRGGWVVIPEMASLLLALSIYTAAFIAEIVRAGIQAVSHGQTEASLSLGLNAGQTLRLIILPQALRVIIPPLTNQYLNLTKNSSLAAAIGYPDLVSSFAGTVLNQTGQAIECIAITMTVYLTLSLLISLAMNAYNRRVALVER